MLFRSQGYHSARVECGDSRYVRRHYIERSRDQLCDQVQIIVSATMPMPSFALYRLPHQDSYTSVVQTVGDTLELHSPVELNGRSGFVVAPFSVTAQYPLLLIRPDVVESQMVGRKCSCHQLLFSGGSVQSLRTVGTDSTCRPDRVSGPSGQTVRTVTNQAQQ